MYRTKQDDNSIYTQEELSFCAADGREIAFTFAVNYDRGVKLCVADIQRIFNNSFEGYLSRYRTENEPEYLYPDDTNPEFELVTVFTGIDMVYSMENPDKGLLCEMLNAIEKRLVRIW